MTSRIFAFLSWEALSRSSSSAILSIKEELIQLEFATEPISGTEAKAQVQPSPRERYKLVSSLCHILYIYMLIDTLRFLLSFDFKDISKKRLT